MVRKAIVDSITSDPAFDGGRYPSDRSEPLLGQTAAVQLMALRMTATPLEWQRQAPTRLQAEEMLEDLTTRLLGHDPCDMVYAFEASRHYNPWPHLAAIEAPLIAVNSADDQVQPDRLLTTFLAGLRRSH